MYDIWGVKDPPENPLASMEIFRQADILTCVYTLKATAKYDIIWHEVNFTNDSFAGEDFWNSAGILAGFSQTSIPFRVLLGVRSYVHVNYADKKGNRFTKIVMVQCGS